VPTRERPRAATIADVKRYWNAHIHDLEISQHQPGSAGFFADLDQYHFEKLHHLLRLVDFDGWRGRDVLEVGCGAGVEPWHVSYWPVAHEALERLTLPVLRRAVAGSGILGKEQVLERLPEIYTRFMLAVDSPPAVSGREASRRA